MLNYYDDRNKVTDTALQIYYKFRTRFVQIDDTLYPQYNITRRAVKKYRYVGMDLTTAKACAAAKRTKYTRYVKGWRWDPEQTPSWIPQNMSQCQADIAIVHVDGAMWNVEINVDETDDVWRSSLPSDFSSLFSIDCDYDE